MHFAKLATLIILLLKIKLNSRAWHKFSVLLITNAKIKFVSIWSEVEQRLLLRWNGTSVFGQLLFTFLYQFLSSTDCLLSTYLSAAKQKKKKSFVSSLYWFLKLESFYHHGGAFPFHPTLFIYGNCIPIVHSLPSDTLDSAINLTYFRAAFSYYEKVFC